MLTPMILASLLVFPGRKTYPRDVATAAASTSASVSGDRAETPRS